MKITQEEKVETFREELDFIYDPYIKSFTELCLMVSPDYFYLNAPSSSSGKYHPIDELGPDGCILHTKRVVTVAYDLCRGLSCEKNRDEIVSACIIHDLRKQGLKQSGHTVKNHPDLAAKLVSEVQTDTNMITNESFSLIKNAVGFHYGPWSQSPWKKPLSSYTPSELCVYLSDYVASKKTLTVKHTDRDM